MNKNASYRPEIDLLKGLAIICVVLIHLIGSSLYYYPLASLTFNAMLILDQFTRLSVPAFVFASGFTLALSSLSKPFSLKDFYLRRVWKILPLYIIWSVIILLVRKYFGDFPPGSVIDPFYSILAWGKADYHLYFVPMIFQLYLLFPLLLYLSKKFGMKTLFVALLWQIIAYWYIKIHTEVNLPGNLVIGDQDQYIFFGSWLFYFVLGLFLAINRDKVAVMTKKLKYLFPVLMLAGLLWAVSDTQRILAAGWGTLIGTRFTKLSILLYSGSLLVCTEIFSGVLNRMNGLFSKILILFGKRSYLIYLFHVLVIRIIYIWVKPDVEWRFILLTFLVLTASLFLAQLFHQLPKISLIFQPLPKPFQKAGPSGRLS